MRHKKDYEGEKKMMHAILKFPSKELAMECFNSKAYQEAKPFRYNSTKDNISADQEVYIRKVSLIRYSDLTRRPIFKTC